MSSELQLDVRHLNRWRRHLVNAYEVRQAWCLLQVKLCDPCLSAFKVVLDHARRYTSARLFTFYSMGQIIKSVCVCVCVSVCLSVCEHSHGRIS